MHNDILIKAYLKLWDTGEKLAGGFTEFQADMEMRIDGRIVLIDNAFVPFPKSAKLVTAGIYALGEAFNRVESDFFDGLNFSGLRQIPISIEITCDNEEFIAALKGSPQADSVDAEATLHKLKRFKTIELQAAAPKF